MPNMIGRHPADADLNRLRAEALAAEKAAAAAPPLPRQPAPQPLPTFTVGASNSGCVAFLSAESAAKAMMQADKAREATRKAREPDPDIQPVNDTTQALQAVQRHPVGSADDEFARYASDDILEDAGLTSTESRMGAHIADHSHSPEKTGIEFQYADLIRETALACVDYSDPSKLWVLLLDSMQDRFPNDTPLAVRLRQLVWNERKRIRKLRKALR